MRAPYGGHVVLLVFMLCAVALPERFPTCPGCPSNDTPIVFLSPALAPQAGGSTDFGVCPLWG